MRPATMLCVACFLSMLLSSCAIQRPVERIQFPEAEYAALAQSGTGVVRGQAFLKTRGGDVKTAAGEEVLLNPVTSYSQQWYSVYLSGRMIADCDSRLHKYVRIVIADGDGRFTFSDVPPGEYFVVAIVRWEAPTGYGLAPQGGLVVKKVSVQDGKTIDVIVTR